MTQNLTDLPDDLPRPENDGACDHLVGLQLPNLDLMATDGRLLNLSMLKHRLVIYCYPMTGQPGKDLPAGWDAIPGARGCTPQSCSFRDHYAELQALGTDVVGLSTQTPSYQKEMVERLHLPFVVLSDNALMFAHALKLPTFDVDGVTLIKRVTLILHNARIEAVHYPVFPSDADPQWVLDYLKTHPVGSSS